MKNVKRDTMQALEHSLQLFSQLREHLENIRLRRKNTHMLAPVSY